MLGSSITSLTSHRVYREILGLALLTLEGHEGLSAYCASCYGDSAAVSRLNPGVSDSVQASVLRKVTYSVKPTNTFLFLFLCPK